MAKIWRGLTRRSNRKKQSYDITRLVDRKVHDEVAAKRHIICDIDKTYLETEFESLVKIARIAFQEASDKVTVRGAADMLLAFRWGYTNPGELLLDHPNPLHFISSSPPQLRSVLSEKLQMDGLDWSSDTFKNQAYNLRVGRVDLLRQHIAYKVCAIMQLISTYPLSGQLFFIGDNAESDAYIYLGVKLYIEERLGLDGFRKYLGVAGVEPDIVEDIVSLYVPAENKLQVGGILIREVPGYQLKRCGPLSDALTSFDNYMTAALYLHQWQVIDSACLPNLIRRFHNFHGLSRERLFGLVSDYSGELTTKDQDIERILEVLAAEGSSPSSPGQFQQPDLSEYNQLSEDDIIGLAEKWLEAMRGAE